MTDTRIDAAAAVAHFAHRLAFETDPADVAAARATGKRMVLVDTRGDAAWAQGRATGAVHLPTADIPRLAAAQIPADIPVVVYCWGPGCNGATKAALAFARLGYRVREMLGGYEYWAREGMPTETDAGPLPVRRDPLAMPVGAIACDC